MVGCKDATVLPGVYVNTVPSFIVGVKVPVGFVAGANVGLEVLEPDPPVPLPNVGGAV